MERLTPEDIILKKYDAIEERYSEICMKLGWGEHTDVLYSFCGIMALGIYVQEKEKYKVGNDGRIRLKKNGREQLASKRRIRNMLEERYQPLLYLLGQKQVKDFAGVYDSIGNLIPIWPGGNEFKGKCMIEGKYCYDIPDLFFRKYGKLEKIYIEDILKLKGGVAGAAMEHFLCQEPPKEHVKEIFELLEKYTFKEYLNFVAHVSDEIKWRKVHMENTGRFDEEK